MGTPEQGKDQKGGTCREMLGGHEVTVFSPIRIQASCDFMSLGLRTAWASSCRMCKGGVGVGALGWLRPCNERLESSRQKCEKTPKQEKLVPD